MTLILSAVLIIVKYNKYLQGRDRFIYQLEKLTGY